MSAVYVWIETFQGQARPTSWEALGAGKILADGLGVPVVGLVFGENASAVAAEVGKHGAKTVLVSEDATLKDYRLEPYAALLAKLVQDNKPAAVVAVATGAGRELLASAAADTDSGMISDVVELKVEGGKVQATRPVYAGKLLSDAVSTGEGTLFVTLRGRAFKAPEATEAGAPTVTTVQPVLSEDQISTKIEGFEAEVGTVNLIDAAIIVSGGRGMANNPKDAPGDAKDAAVWKAQDAFTNMIQPLADVLGGAVGASRAAVDAGYIPYAHQVGQTGKTVSPDLYIACAISGA